MSSFIGILLLGLVAGGMASTGFARDLANSIPKYPYDPNTTKQCTWWLDSDGLLGCEEIQNLYGVSLVDFMSWVWRDSLGISAISNSLAEPLCT